MSKVVKTLDIAEDLEQFTSEKFKNGLDKLFIKSSFKTIKKELKAFEIIKEKLVVGYDESENDKPCLTLGVKDNEGVLLIFYITFDKEKINLLKEALL